MILCLPQYPARYQYSYCDSAVMYGGWEWDSDGWRWWVSVSLMCSHRHQKWWSCVQRVATTRRLTPLCLETEVRSRRPAWHLVTTASMSLSMPCSGSHEEWRPSVLTTQNTLFLFHCVFFLVSSSLYCVYFFHDGSDQFHNIQSHFSRPMWYMTVLNVRHALKKLITNYPD